MTHHRVRTECAVAGKRLDEAKASLDEGWGLIVLEPYRAYFEILRARVDAGLGHESTALAKLRALVLTEMKRSVLQGLEAKLALGEAELRIKRERGRARLVALQTEATQLGFKRIARLAGEELGVSSARPGSK